MLEKVRGRERSENVGPISKVSPQVLWDGIAGVTAYFCKLLRSGLVSSSLMGPRDDSCDRSHVISRSGPT
jgi:hypothetical protein